jgi:uncharacterized repeat protein (TIGR04138 family)
MSKISFDSAVRKILAEDTRYASGAYEFLRDSLEQTIKVLQKNKARKIDHVSGPELCDGWREHAINQYGPMVPIIMEEWGIRGTRDIGEMVFSLIRAGAFSKSDADNIADFVDVYAFDDVFVKPFLPKRAITPTKVAAAKP